MSEDEFESPAPLYLVAHLSVLVLLFPIAVTLNIVLDGVLSGWEMIGGCFLLSIPGAALFVFSGRGIPTLGKYVLAVTVLWVVSIVLEPLVYLSLGAREPIALVQIGLLAFVYGVSYLLVYRDGLDRIRATVAA
jgi:hypothetical protein